MDGFIAFVVVLIVTMIGAATYSAGRISVLDDCNNYGASVIGDFRIECKKAESGKGEK